MFGLKICPNFSAGAPRAPVQLLPPWNNTWNMIDHTLIANMLCPVVILTHWTAFFKTDDKFHLQKIVLFANSRSIWMVHNICTNL